MVSGVTVVRYDIRVDSLPDVGIKVDSNQVAVQQSPTTVGMEVVAVPGPPGPAYEGTAWWYGDGKPGTIVGAKAGDYYMDVVTGDVYKLK